MTAKFKLGDKVLLNGRTPNWLSKRSYRRRARTIVKIKYHPELQATLYYLGDNRHDCLATPCNLGFRSYQLKPITGKRGRPRTKRVYNKTGKYAKANSIVKILAASPNHQQSLDISKHDKSLRPLDFNAILDDITLNNSLTEVLK